MLDNLVTNLSWLIPTKWRWIFQHEGVRRYSTNTIWLFLGQAGMVVNAFLRRGKLGWWAVRGKIEAGQGSY